jgi:2-methylcitrate dehydratase PrpD
MDGIGGEFGALRVFITPGEYDEQQIADTFGSPWNIVAKEIRIKPYPCCRWAHRPLDALLALMRGNDVPADAVETIECEVGAHVSAVMAYRVARTELQAKFCLPYCLAVAVCDGRAGLGQFTDERVRDARVQALAARVKVIHPDGKSEFDTGTRLPCTVRVRLKNGTVLEQSAGAARGDRENPMTFEGIVEKYRDCTRGLLAAEKAERVVTLVQNIEDVRDLTELFSILTFDIRA